MVKIALDAMGGDNAPAEIVKGAVQAIAADKDCFVYLVGKEDKIKECLNGQQYDSSRIEIVNADDVIETGEPPVMAIRRKKESSLVKAMYMVKNKEADAFVSAGSSGAILVGGQTIVGRLRGVDRPPMAALIPTKMVFHCLLTVVLMWMQEQLCLYSGLLWVLYTWRMLLELRIQELQLSMSDLRKKRGIHLSKKHIQCLKSVLTLTL